MTRDTKTPFDVAAFAPHFDHHTLEYGQHLYEIYDHMRETCPVSHSDALGGFWVLTRNEDIMRVARDDETFSSADGITIPSPPNPDNRSGPIPISLDPPESKAFRRLLDPLVSPKAIKAMEPDIWKLAIGLVDDFIETGKVDLALDLAQPVTGIVTIKMTGLPVEDWHAFADPLHRNIWGIGDRTENRRMAEESRKLVGEHVARQRTKPVAGGVIEYLMKAELDGRKLENWEIEAIVNLFIVGGVDTTQALLGSAWVYFGRHTDRRQEVIDDIDNLGEAVEEMLRYFAPQQALCRTATRDVEIGGKQIKKGEQVLMCWASANRDPSEFENPGEIDFHRPHNRHMTFGVGSHRCMGSNLARLEAKVCMEQVLTRLPDYKLVEEGIEFAPDVGTVYGYSAVPITFTPGRKMA